MTSDGKDAIDDDGVNCESVKREVDEGSLRFAQDHFFGIGDEADAGDFRIFEESVHAFEFVEEIADVDEIAVRGQVEGRDAIGDGADGLQEIPLKGKDVLHIPIESGGHADEAQRFGGGSGIEDDDVVTLLAAVLVDVHHRAELFHAGKDGEFFGFDSADAGSAEDGTDVGGDFLPVALDLFLDIELEDGEAVVDRERVRSFVVEKLGIEVEGIGETVGRVNTHHQSAVTEGGEFYAGGRGEAGLAYAAFAAEEKNPHGDIISPMTVFPAGLRIA